MTTSMRACTPPKPTLSFENANASLAPGSSEAGLHATYRMTDQTQVVVDGVHPPTRRPMPIAPAAPRMWKRTSGPVPSWKPVSPTSIRPTTRRCRRWRSTTSARFRAPRLVPRSTMRALASPAGACSPPRSPVRWHCRSPVRAHHRAGLSGGERQAHPADHARCQRLWSVRAHRHRRLRAAGIGRRRIPRQ